MGNFKRNSLFRLASSRQRADARRKWAATDAAKAINQVHSALNSSTSFKSGASHAIDYALRTWKKQSAWTEDAVSRLANADFGGIVREVQRYARAGGTTGRLLASLLESLGPLGSLIKSLTESHSRSRKSGIGGDIDSAVQFLDAVAPQVLSGPGRKQARTATGRTTAAIAEQIEAAKDLLEQSGYQVKDPKELAREAKKQETYYPSRVPTTTKSGAPRQVVDLQIDGRNRRFPVTHPIVTGAYVPADSSNVHSFSYSYDKSRLYVRFHPSGAANRGKGSLYAYEHVPPRLFLLMLDAPSKGGFIWDWIRIRGTVSGHRFDYRLVAVTGEYVPRKATHTPEGEKFIGREMQFTNLGSQERRTLRSTLPDTYVNRGTPNRGTPNRGR